MSPAERQPAFSIVMPTHQRRDTVCDAVRAVGRIAYDGELELIVVVDGSTDGTAEALLRIELPFAYRVIEQANRGAASARNRGAAEATGDVLLFLDDDMICEPDIVAQHAASHAEGADAVLGDIPLDPASPPGPLARAVGQGAERRREALGKGAPLTLHDLLTGQLSVKRAVFEALGGFDERFTAGGSFGNEDLDFGVRLLERHDVRYNPRAISRQRYVVTPRGYLRQWREAGAADVHFAYKHPTQARALFEAHGRSSRRSRLLRALSAVPGVTSLAGATAVPLTRALGSWAAGLLFAARDLAYWRGVREASARGIAVLCYHAVADLSGDPVLAEYGIAPDAFARQLDALREGGVRFVGPDELLAFLDRGLPLPRGSALLTFDDCYAELPAVARGILRPRGIPAVAFAVAGMVGGANDWDRPLGARALPLADAAGLAELADLGVEIGCHSLGHRDLKGLPEAELAAETAGAADVIETLGLPRPRLFAYPYGELDGAAKAAVRRAGFRAGLGLDRRPVTRRSDRYALPRFEVLASAPTEQVLRSAAPE